MMSILKLIHHVLIMKYPHTAEMEINSIYIKNLYRISSNKRPRRLLNFKTVRCSAYYSVALIRGRRLFQS